MGFLKGFEMKKTRLDSFLEDVENDYRGLHTAPQPSHDSAAPLHDLTGVYPDDIYSDKAVQYYGHGISADSSAISIIQNCKNRPNAVVKIFRAVPKVEDVFEKAERLVQEKAYILKKGKIPPGVVTTLDRSDYYGQIDSELEKLKASGELDKEQTKTKLKINNGDWVAIVRAYAVQHGKSALQGNYVILTKSVKAKNLWTDGNSIHEWGMWVE